MDYSITTSSDVYDPDSGKISSLKGGSFEFAISASDEANNKTTVNFVIHVDATLYITKDKDMPIVLYEGELGKYVLISATHYSNWETSPRYMNGYYFDIEFENKADTETRTSFGRAYLNDYRVMVYGDADRMVAPGKKGVNTCSIYDEDLDEKTKAFEKIECEFIIIDANDKDIFARPVVMDRDFISFK